MKTILFFLSVLLLFCSCERNQHCSKKEENLASEDEALESLRLIVKGDLSMEEQVEILNALSNIKKSEIDLTGKSFAHVSTSSFVAIESIMKSTAKDLDTTIAEIKKNSFNDEDSREVLRTILLKIIKNIDYANELSKEKGVRNPDY